MTESNNIHSNWDNIIKKSGFLDIIIEELYHEGDEIHGDGFTIYLSNIIKNRNKRDRDREYNYETFSEKIKSKDKINERKNVIEESSNDLEYRSNCLDNLCIISQFCKISSLEEYVIFIEQYLT